MALYYYTEHLHRNNTSTGFDQTFNPGDRTGWSGIYRCEVCGNEVVHTHEKPLPPQNHHQHPFHQPIKWRCIVTDRA